MHRQSKKPINQTIASVPEFSLALPKQVANPTSKRPPKINKSQFTTKAL
jgi:hypothetical protein